MTPDRDRPRVDVLIPAFNAERTIVDAVESIRRQSVGEIRILVLNDGSTDRTSALAHAMAGEDPRILVLDQPNAGIVAARNTLVERSHAPYLAMQDADDRSFPDRLARQLAYLEANPDCVAVGANAWYIDDDGRRLGGRSTFGGDVRPDPHAIPSVEPYLPQPLLMVRREAIVAAGGYRELTNAEDTDLYWRLLTVGRLHNLPDVLGEYRIHSLSASSAAARSGRLSSVGSQLSALSHRRRLAGKSDIDVSAETTRQLLALDDVEAMVALFSAQLSPSERIYLRAAVAAKLVELASYRPYLLAAGDCRFLRDALPAARAGKARGERLRLRYQQAHVLRRLLRNGRLKEVAALRASPAVYAGILPALAARRFKALLQGIRRAG